MSAWNNLRKGNEIYADMCGRIEIYIQNGLRIPLPQGSCSISLSYKRKVDPNAAINKVAFNSSFYIFIFVFLSAFSISYINESPQKTQGQITQYVNAAPG